VGLLTNNQDWETSSLYNDDCMKVLKKLPSESVHFILTDPPYGTTACKWDIVIPFDRLWTQLKRVIKKNGVIAIFGSEPFSSYLRLSNINWFKYDWIWEKQKASNFMGAKYSPLKYHEIISIFAKGKHYYNPQKYKVLEINDIVNLSKAELQKLFETKEYDRFGKVDKRKTIKNPKTNKEHIGNKIQRTRNIDSGYRHPKSVLKINKEVNTNLHPTQKPVRLLEYFIRTYTRVGDTVLDFTMGSGSTGVACRNTDRNFIGIELDVGFFNIAKKRIA